ncbi:pentapeptide repeat-containing protein [Streptomyces mirabilis]|uniref:pentapeptide repeat-containing protein n=1 Tax=Streptomyces mirabilis TaxID=68239 RepID=UPI003317FCC2
MRELLDAMHDPDINAPRFGQIDFTEAIFTGDASFHKAVFTKDASFAKVLSSGDMIFSWATFHGIANFDEARMNSTRFASVTFSQDARFRGANIRDAWFFGSNFSSGAEFGEMTCEVASFGRVTFSKRAQFDHTTYRGDAMFHEVKFLDSCEFTDAKFGAEAYFGRTLFNHYAHFSDATFSGPALFGGAIFNRGARFDGVKFHGTQTFGPLACLGTLDLTMAVFNGPTIIEAAAAHMSCERTEWQATGALRILHTELDLTNATFTQPYSISSPQGPFSYRRRVSLPSEREFILDDSSISWQRETSSVTSLRGVDCSMLSISDIDLSLCRFSGALNLDLLRLEGRCTLQSPPEGRIHPLFPPQWARRQVIEEERQWRALPTHPTLLRAGWGAPPQNSHDVPGLATLTVIYRQLRKAREDSKDEPGAADFYYGEMEMRRHSKEWGTAERWLLQAYWFLSGYGLRASRALGWLALAMITTILLMMGFGLPQDSPKQSATGTVPLGGGRVTFEIDKEDPRNPTGDRFTGERLDKALSVTLNSVVFRSSGQDLTTAGGYIEMASRFSEPILLGLAALAIRGRVKR